MGHLSRAAVVIFFASCADLSKHSRADDYVPPSTQSAYVIRPGDMLNVRVYSQEDISEPYRLRQQQSMSVRGRVRPDGKIALPPLQNVQAAGLMATDLAQEVETRLAKLLNGPLVTVTVEDQQWRDN